LRRESSKKAVKKHSVFRNSFVFSRLGESSGDLHTIGQTILKNFFAKSVTNRGVKSVLSVEAMLTANEGQKTRTLSEQEIEQLFLDHYNLLYAAAKSVTNNKHDAEDIVQKLFLKFLQETWWPEMTTLQDGLYRPAVFSLLRLSRLSRLDG
jgi:hypothetical protein